MHALVTAQDRPNPFQGEPLHPYRERVVPFTAGDGAPLNLVNVRGPEDPTRGPVIVVHGAGVRANLFRAPTRTTIVDALIEAGYDVWLENWRSSINFPLREYTLDDAAVFDHPKAVEKIVDDTGHAEVKAVIHCQGSTTFTMSLLAGLVPQVTHVVSNAVSLHPVVVSPQSNIKLNVAVPLVSLITPYLDCSWGLDAPTLQAKLITALVKATHRECDNTVCRLTSFTYGFGFPALWSHDNLSEQTHKWLQYEFAAVPMTFFKHIARCARAGNLVSVKGYPELPGDFAAQPPKTDARWAFFAGRDNKVFVPQSQERSFEWFDKHQPGRHALHLLDGYGHLDVFMGSDSGEDVFPTMIAELEG